MYIKQKISISKLRLEGKVAIITGAASRIGEAVARLFAAHGATVIIANIQDELGQSVAASIGSERCSYHHCDVTDEKQVEETVGYAVSKYGKLDTMCNNAGVLGPVEGIVDVDLGAFAGSSRLREARRAGGVRAWVHRGHGDRFN